MGKSAGKFPVDDDSNIWYYIAIKIFGGLHGKGKQPEVKNYIFDEDFIGANR